MPRHHEDMKMEPIDRFHAFNTSQPHNHTYTYTRQVTCLDPMKMEPIDRIQTIQKERWELQCNICKQRVCV